MGTFWGKTSLKTLCSTSSRSVFLGQARGGGMWDDGGRGKFLVLVGGGVWAEVFFRTSRWGDEARREGNKAIS